MSGLRPPKGGCQEGMASSLIGVPEHFRDVVGSPPVLVSLANVQSTCRLRTVIAARAWLTPKETPSTVSSIRAPGMDPNG